MDKALLREHISTFLEFSLQNPKEYQDDLEERGSFTKYYKRFTKEKILSMNEEDVYEYIYLGFGQC